MGDEDGGEMPELANRDKMESTLARELAKIGGAGVVKITSVLLLILR